MRTTLGIGALLAALFISGCQCGGPRPEEGGTGGGEPDAGGVGGGTGGGTPGTGGGSTGGGSATGGGTAVVVDPNDLNNPNKDSDCDGLTDAEEFGNVYAGNKRTDPAKADTDGDGILDGVEAGRTSSIDPSCMFMGDVDPATRTLPTETDSDQDGLSDGLEDTNKNGRLDSGETDATNPDTDFDSLKDGAEDKNQNGTVDSGETDPRKRDTDGDFINDGIELNVTKTDPTKPDTDGDTCVDGAEDFNQNGVKNTGETDPLNAMDCGPANNPDSDGDGLPNSIEDKNMNGTVDMGETNPMVADTDGDGLKDGVEDRNKNGLVDPGETNPLNVDTDCDGLLDGPDTAMKKGEDQNANGTVDAAETDPTKADTDGDGITDGVERGITAAQRADTVKCLNVPFDADPLTTTDPTRRDSDGDGIDDGAEDTNQNGKVDTGELDPKNMTDGTGPAGQVCTQMNLRPVLFKTDLDSDLQLGLPATFTEVSTMTVGTAKRGLIGFDPVNKVAFVAWRQAAPAGATTPAADEAALRNTLDGVGNLTNPTTQNFTSWDALPALQAFYDMDGAVDVKARANAIANAMVGAGAGSLTANTMPANGPFQIQAEYLHRANSAVVVILAITPKANYTGAPLFSMSDSAGGSAVAQFGDANANQCEKFTPRSGKVDFLFVVDDSCSMAGSQQALADAANAMANLLNNSTLDWRVALVTSAYHRATGVNRGLIRGFVAKNDANAINTFRGWLTKNPACTTGSPACTNSSDPCWGTTAGWVGICGSGAEAMMGGVRKAVNDLAPATAAGAAVAANRWRADADPVIVMLGDADDQSVGYTDASVGCATTCESTSVFSGFFLGTGAAGQSTRNPLGRAIPVHGIICPTGASCNGEYQANPQRHPVVISATNGVRGAINGGNASITASMTAIVNATIAAAGYKMQKPPIGASVKVAMNDVENPTTCNKNDLPRSRQNGFDFDGVNRSISFFGACRPSAATNSAAVSYRYWIDTTPDPTGNPPPCESDTMFYDPTDPDFCKGKLQCDLTLNQCVCPSNCGGNAPPGKVCNPNRLVCDFVCTSDCGGTCNGFQQCNTSACACECVQTASCAVGYKFQNGGGVCGCVCDGASLNCGATYQPDLNSCSCVCQPNCGGCPAGQNCNPSTCSCSGGIN